ncbi:transcription initiation factor TFIID subunit 4B [Bufo bufo]|uniref:transcription initiation factor TFIID subunit 4B n=1 Tax=Bufo bufo TaxID=8384 RepID=UPI001ABDBFCC|nr:transcription initiation factor TFIID subunit 4B [Bufo bufo]
MHATQAPCSAAPAVVSHAVPAHHGLSSSLPAVPAGNGSLVPASTLVTKVVPSTQAAKVTSGPKMTAAQQRAPLKASAIQLPANFQIPPGTVLLKSSNGQLMLVSQQALARAQAQNPGNQLVSSLASSNGKAVPLSASLTPVSSTVTFQRSPNQMQSTGTPSGTVKVSSSVASKANTSVPSSTFLRICTTPQTVSNSQGTSTVIIRASAPSPVTISCTSPAATTTTPSTVGVTGTSALALNSSTVAVLPIRTSVSPVTPIAVNSCSSVVMPTATEVLDNVKKCKNFLATLIKLASSGPQSPTMGQNVKNLVKNLLDSKLEPEEFTTKLYKELKSSPQPYLVPFLKKSLPSLRRLMPNSQEFILQCGHQNPVPVTTATNSITFVKITPSSATQTVKPVGSTAHGTVQVHQATCALPQPLGTLKPMNIKQMVVQQPSSGLVKQVTTLPSNAALNKPGEKRLPVNALIQTGHLPPASVVKQITVPGNKVISLQASTLPMKENNSACFREEDDINDVTSMAGVNLNEENACILATNSELVGAVIRSCKDEPFLFTSALQTRILDIGKRHDIKELNSDVMNLVSHATQERLRGLIEKLTVAAQHRSTNCKQSDRHVQSSDVRAQLKFLEQLEHLEKQRKTEEEREMLLRAAKSRANKEDPEQLKLKQKAKEMQQLELEQIQYREANLAALAAIGPRRKRPLDTSIQNVMEGFHTSGSSVFSVPKSIFVPRITRVSLRDLIFCMEQERTTKHSMSLYRALLK